MNKTSIVKSFNQIGATFSKHMPDILVGLGIVAGAATVYTAAKQTLNMPDILDEAKEEIETVKKEVKPDENEKVELVKVYGKTVLKIADNYKLPIALGVGSVTSILYGTGMLKKRYAGAIAAAGTYESMFSNLYKNVAEKYGEEEARQLRYGVKEETVETTVQGKNGKEKKVTETKKVLSDEAIETITTSDIARIFDELNPNWSKYGGDNLRFLKRVQDSLNMDLDRHGYLFLNEVYKALGFPETQAGAVIGWIKKDIEDGVDFGIFDRDDRNKCAFVDGYDRSAIVLDFRYAKRIQDAAPRPIGVIIDKIGLDKI